MWDRKTEAHTQGSRVRLGFRSTEKWCNLDIFLPFSWSPNLMEIGATWSALAGKLCLGDILWYDISQNHGSLGFCDPF